MKTFLSLLLLLISATNAFAVAKIQNEDIKSLAQVIAAGGSIVNLPNDSKIYLTNASLAVQLSTAIASGDVYSSVTAPIFRQLVTPANPAAGFNKCYTKADEKFYCLSSAGVESLIGPVAGVPGTPNTFTGYDATGQLYTIPGWAINSLDGVDANHALTAVAATSDFLYTFQGNVNPAVSTNDYSAIIFPITSTFDQGNLGNDMDATLATLHVTTTHEGDGHVGNMNTFESNVLYGNGTAGSLDGGTVIRSQTTVAANFQLDDLNVLSHNATANAAALVSNYSGVNLNYTGPLVNNYTGFNSTVGGNAGGNYSGITQNMGGNVTGGFVGVAEALNGDAATYTSYQGTVTGNIGSGNAFTHSLLGNVTTDYGILSSTVTGNIGGNYQGIFESVAGDVNNFSGVNVSHNSGNATGTGEGYRVSFSNGTYTGKTALTALMGDGVSSSSGRIIEASWADGDYNNRIGINLNGGTGDTTTSETGISLSQSTGTSASFTGFNLSAPGGTTGSWQGVLVQPNGGTATSAVGLASNLSSLSTPGQQKVGLSVSDGVIQADGQYDTSNLSATPGFGQIHQLGGTFTVASGSPMSNSAVVANNLAFNAVFDDDMGADAFGGFLGYTNVGYLGQVAVAATKTVDTINMALAGASVPAGSGTVTNGNMYAAGGFLPAGGTLTIGTMSGFHALSALCSGATTCYSLWSESASAQLLNAGSIRSNTSLILEDPGAGANTWTIQSPTLAGDFTLTLPVDDGAAGQVLSTNGAGVTSWVNAPTAAYSVSTKVADYTMTDSDDVILVDASAGAVTITLHDPAAATAKRYSIKKIDSSVNPVIVDVATADLIDGEATQIIGAQNQSVDFVPDATTPAWFMF